MMVEHGLRRIGLFCMLQCLVTFKDGEHDHDVVIVAIMI